MATRAGEWSWARRRGVFFGTWFHVAADCDAQPEKFDGQSANHKRGAQGGIRKQNEGGDGKKETGRHHQQSRIFHGLPFQASPGDINRPPEFCGDGVPPSGPGSAQRGTQGGVCFVTERYWLRSLLRIL